MLATDLNLDSMERDQLIDFAARFVGHGVRPIRAAKELFPEQPKGYVQATRDLRNYAWNKATAMACRLEGKIDTAIAYENICDRIYNELPEYAKGW
jgi:hypothetical protein